VKYAVRHVTTYRYAAQVSGCHNLVHLTPRQGPNQQLFRWELEILPEPETTSTFEDYFGNDATFFTIHQSHQQLQISATSTVAVEKSTVEVEKSPPWEEVRASVRAHGQDDTLDAFQYLWDSPFVKSSGIYAGYAKPSFVPGRPFLVAVQDLNRRIFEEFKYKPATTTIATPMEEVFEKRIGVCQDFAHLMICCLRSLGFAARYVSGYLRTLPPKPDPTKPKVPMLIGADASHAWLAVYCPGIGWVDFDPTNNLIVSDQHITLAWGRDYDDVSPIKGVVIGGGEHKLEVGVSVQAMPD